MKFCFGLAACCALLALSACAAVVPVAAGGVVVYQAKDGFFWEVEDRLIAPDTYRLTVKQGRFRSGQGQARLYFQRRAEDIVAVQGCTGYTTLEYTESLSSDVLNLPQRVSEGVIRCERKQANN